MVIAIDFDGTVVTHEYPKVGQDTGATQTLLELIENGHQLILYTMRDGPQLEEAIKWFEDRNIPLWAVNKNPEQSSWTGSAKVYANLYIDDAALGVPLVSPTVKGMRPFVDWEQVRELLWQRRYLQ